MNHIIESVIEEFAIELLGKSGYQYVYASNIDTPGSMVLATIQKFQPEEGNVCPKRSKRKNIIVIVNEAPQTQYEQEATI
jgi:type I site-specific restriction-modification system R (restriction) subunit